ncbi:MAG: hypothetical protein EP335_05080 [Alphaproteobacteria bacterium]|nr:MAG: hypothetical protein EP335_05080 [Alphaproteobacteria bacterium]
MAIKLYLHIGHPKCGSSTLQQALFENRRALLKAGIGVCDRSLGLMSATSAAMFPIGYLRKLYDLPVPEAEAEVAEKFRLLAKKAAAKGLKAVVLSAENLASTRGVNLLKEARPYFDCDVIYYIRRQDDWLLSSWLQWQFKTGESLSDFIERRLQMEKNYLYRDVLEACIETFGQEKLRVRTLFRRNLVGESLVPDFWSALGVDAASMAEVASQNVSLSPNLVGVLKESPYLYDGSHDNSFSSFIGDYHAYGQAASKGRALSAATRRAILKYFFAENRWINQTFLNPDEVGGWLMVQDDSNQKPVAETVTLSGLAEAINLNLAMLREIREDVDKIKKALGLR